MLRRQSLFQSFVFAFSLLSFGLAQSTISLYTSGLLNDTVISAGCTNALKASINCNPYWLQLTAADVYTSLVNSTQQDSYCATTCGSSLSSYRASVITACKSDPSPWTGVPATWTSDAIYSVYNRTCLKDTSTGKYCTDYIASIAPSVDGKLSSLPKAQLCSPCVLGLVRQAQATAFSNYGPIHAQDMAKIQSTCGVTIPTDVKPPVANVSLPNFAPVNSSAKTTCLSGATYVVQSGDNCQKIAAAKNVATGTLISINNIFPDCSNLIAGATLCLPKTCQTYLVQSGDTCWSIANVKGLTLNNILAWNPTINPTCTNLLSGVNICISPDAASYTPTTIAGATVTKTNQYATATIAPPSPTPFGTTSKCGKYYQAQSGDYCQVISVNNTISLDLFRAINPSINQACDNLSIGFWYCVFPTSDWNSTAAGTGSSTTAAPPAPTPSGTTNSCYTWYTIKSGDTCSVIQQQYGITFTDLQRWNPQINSGCTNLLVGDAYCVKGPAASSASSTAPPTSSTTVAPPGPTATGTSSACYKWYKVVSGDTCDKIDTANGITLAQFRSWNTAVDTNCSNLVVGNAYCVKA